MFHSLCPVAMPPRDKPPHSNSSDMLRINRNPTRQYTISHRGVYYLFLNFSKERNEFCHFTFFNTLLGVNLIFEAGMAFVDGENPHTVPCGFVTTDSCVGIQVDPKTFIVAGVDVGGRHFHEANPGFDQAACPRRRSSTTARISSAEKARRPLPAS